MCDKPPKCIACKNTIEPGASICPICSSYQQNWLNRLKYIATISAAISIFAAGLFFVGNQTLKIYNHIFWKDTVEVLDLSSTSNITLANIGDGDVFLHHLHYNSSIPLKHVKKIDESSGTLSSDILTGHLSAHRPIGEPLPKGDMKTFKLKENFLFPFQLFETNSLKEWENNLIKAFDTNDNCVCFNVYLENGPSFLVYKNMKRDDKKKYSTYPMDARLIYYSLNSGQQLEKPIDAIGAILVSTAEECQ